MSAGNEPFSLDIEERKRGKVAIITMDLLPPNNTFNREMQIGFLDTMNRAADQADAIVVTSANEKFFSNGMDGKFLVESDTEMRKETVFAMVRFFGDVLACPKPIIAEIGGFAMAGGAVLSVACDYRYMLADSGRIGFSELLVGFMLPACYTRGMHALVQPSAVRFMVEGAAYKPAEAEAIGLIDGVADSREALRKQVMKRVDGILRLNPLAYLSTRNAYRKTLLEQVRADEPGDIRNAEMLIESPDFEAALGNIAGKNK